MCIRDSSRNRLYCFNINSSKSLEKAFSFLLRSREMCIRDRLQPEHPAAWPGADDTRRACHHAGGSLYFTASGPAPVLFPKVRLEAAPQLQIHG